MTYLVPLSGIASQSEADLDKLVDAIERKEGFHQNANTRQEKWIDSTIISATNGSAPIAGFELQLESAGKTKTITANEFGQFRPIPHMGKTPTIVKAPKPDGSWEKLLELSEQTTTRIYSQKAARQKKTVDPHHRRVRPSALDGGGHGGSQKAGWSP